MKRNYMILLWFSLSCVCTTWSQVGVGTTTPNTNSSIDIVSTTQGVRFPVMTSAQRAAISNPAKGLIVFDSTLDRLMVNKGTSVSPVWINLGKTSDDVLAQIGNEGDNPDTVNSIVTVAELSIITGITGVDIADETLYQDYIDANPDAFSSPATVAEVQAMMDLYNNVVISAEGREWMDRNLGASQVATSKTDYLAYGSLIQWGRAADGHEVINWTSSTTTDGTEQSRETTTLSSSSTPGHDDFIVASSNPSDWISPQNANLWQGVNGVNNPCIAGFRVPTEAEWETERLSWSSNDADGAFASPLKLTVSGFRDYFDGSISFFAGISGSYWSSTTSGTTAQYVFLLNPASISVNLRATGQALRCIRD